MIIVGLGNPGIQYAYHRHTVGHMFIDWIAHQQPHSSWRVDPKHLFDYQKVITDDQKEYIVAKTRTFMNASGQSVLALLRYFDAQDTSELCVAHDDLDLPVGVWKLDFAKGPKLHNGINSVESSNRTNEFWRVRIGVDNRPADQRIGGEIYVLQDFTDEQRKQVYAVFPAMWERIRLLPRP